MNERKNKSKTTAEKKTIERKKNSLKTPDTLFPHSNHKIEPRV